MSTRDLWYSDNPKGASATRIHLYPDCGSLTYPFKASERDTWVRDVPKCARCLKRAEKAASHDTQ